MSEQQPRTNRPFHVGVSLAAVFLILEFLAWPTPMTAEFRSINWFGVWFVGGLVLTGALALWARWRGDEVDPHWWSGALAVFVITLLMGGWLIPMWAPSSRQSHSNVTLGISNCRLIEIALWSYSHDHNGKYPDAAIEHPRTSNEVFRKLIAGGYLENERVFGCPKSLAAPDGNIGQAPDFLEAVKAGENHWAMTKGLTDDSPPEVPFVFENPAVATWPPKWNADAVKAPLPGRVWSGGRVIVGLHDGSANLMQLESDKGTRVGLKPNPNGSPIFPDLHPTPEILNIER